MKQGDRRPLRRRQGADRGVQPLSVLTRFDVGLGPDRLRFGFHGANQLATTYQTGRFTCAPSRHDPVGPGWKGLLVV